MLVARALVNLLPEVASMTMGCIEAELSTLQWDHKRRDVLVHSSVAEWNVRFMIPIERA